MDWEEWTMVGLAAGFLVLALYGKYRNLKEQYREALEEDDARRRAAREAEPPPRGTGSV